MKWIGNLGFVAELAANLFRAPRTEAYPLGPAPEAPKSLRGRVRVEADKCVGCSTCAQVCVGDAIHLQEQEEGVRLIVWHGRCTFCGLCAYYCPTGALELSNDWNLAHANADKYAMVEDVIAKYQVCVDCGTRLMVPHGNVFAASAIGTDRHNQMNTPRCDACRRKQQARLVKETRL